MSSLREPSWRVGWILGPTGDSVWFLGLPFIAVAAGLACQELLPFAALAAVNLWITIPHHGATWIRTYGLAEDWHRWKDRLILGPLVILGLALLGGSLAPLTLALLVTMWDHQHSIMQQHGFSRIYDFKARTGTPLTGRFDLALNWVLFGNMFLNAPLFTQYWVRELYRWHLPVSVSTVLAIQQLSWLLSAVVLIAYAGHILRGFSRGVPVNPVKLGFIASSYFLWYFTAWATDSILVFGVAHRLMHGLQYIVIVGVFLRNKADKAAGPENSGGGIATRLVRSAGFWRFILVSAVYAAVFQLIVHQPMTGTFGFGLVDVGTVGAAIPELQLGSFGARHAYELFTVALIEAVAMVHYYFDSFIWKVSDRRVQGGL